MNRDIGLKSQVVYVGDNNYNGDNNNGRNGYRWDFIYNNMCKIYVTLFLNLTKKFSTN